MSPNPTRQWSEDEWLEFYADPLHFTHLFDDYKSLNNQRERFTLSTAQERQMRAIEQMIEAKLGL